MDLALLGLVFLVVLVLLGGLSHGIMLLLPLPFLDLQHEHAFVFFFPVETFSVSLVQVVKQFAAWGTVMSGM